MAAVSLDRIRDRLRAAFWLIPSACAVVAVGLAIGLVGVDRDLGDAATRYLFPGPPEGARSFLGAITGAMISFTGLVFSITVVVLVLTSGQFSPRVLRRFLRDRTIQWTLGVFVATFLFAMTVHRTVLGTNDSGAFVPRIAVTFAFVLVLVSVGLFVHYIHHITTMIQVAAIITDLGRETRGILDRRCPPDPPPELPAPTLASEGVEVTAPRSGMVASVAERRIAQRACREGLVVVLVPRVGDFVACGAPLCIVHGDGPADWVRGQIAIDDERTMEQDVAFGFRQLVDIAERALSPSTNDPTTACQAIDAMHDLLRRIVTRPLPTGRHAGAPGHVGLIVPQYSGEDYLDVALAEVWHYGAGSTQVPDRLAALLRDLRTVARPEHRPAVERWCARVL
jgi:uncharacterized membrane protein